MKKEKILALVVFPLESKKLLVWRVDSLAWVET